MLEVFMDVIDVLDGVCHIILPNQGIEFTLFSVASGLYRRATPTHTHTLARRVSPIIDPFPTAIVSNDNRPTNGRKPNAVIGWKLNRKQKDKQLSY